MATGTIKVGAAKGGGDGDRAPADEGVRGQSGLGLPSSPSESSDKISAQDRLEPLAVAWLGPNLAASVLDGEPAGADNAGEAGISAGVSSSGERPRGRGLHPRSGRSRLPLLGT